MCAEAITPSDDAVGSDEPSVGSVMGCEAESCCALLVHALGRYMSAVNNGVEETVIFTVYSA